MKTAIICPICLKPKKESDSYAVKITDYSSDPNVGGNFLQKKVRVCRTCAKRMGYKVKATKKVVKSNGNV